MSLSPWKVRWFAKKEFTPCTRSGCTVCPRIAHSMQQLGEALSESNLQEK